MTEMGADSPPRKDSKRARIGLIIPSSNRTVEQELVPSFPSSVGVHIARVRVKGLSTIDLLPSIAAGAEMLSDAFCDVIVFHCTASCMEQGVGVNTHIIEAIQRASGKIARTTASAVIDAVRALAIRDIVLLTPYSETVTARQCSFLHEIGLRVIDSRYKDLNKSPDYCYIPSSYWFESLMRTANPRAEAYLLSCANIPCMDFINRAEDRLARPVLTSNQAVLWDSLRQAGVDDRLENFGRLGTLPGMARV